MGGLTGSLAYIFGIMKISNNRTKLAIASTIAYANTDDVGLELFDFDATTGIVSNSRLLRSGVHCYGICFSPDDTKLYLQWEDLNLTMSQVCQYDISQTTLSAIVGSKVNICTAAVAAYADLKLGADDKMYVNDLVNTDYVALIDSPNNAGLACHYVSNYMGLIPGSQCFYGFANQYVKPMCAVGVTPSRVKGELRIYPNPVVDEMVVESGEGGVISIYNVLGQAVYSAKLEKGKTIISTKGFAKGMYFVELVYGDGVREVRKIIKE